MHPCFFFQSDRFTAILAVTDKRNVYRGNIGFQKGSAPTPDGWTRPHGELIVMPMKPPMMFGWHSLANQTVCESENTPPWHRVDTKTSTASGSVSSAVPQFTVSHEYKQLLADFMVIIIVPNAFQTDEIKKSGTLSKLIHCGLLRGSAYFVECDGLQVNQHVMNRREFYNDTSVRHYFTTDAWQNLQLRTDAADVAALVGVVKIMQHILPNRQMQDCDSVHALILDTRQHELREDQIDVVLTLLHVLRRTHLLQRP